MSIAHAITVADMMLQAGIEANTAEALARWKLAIEHSRRKQGQRWRRMSESIAAQIRAAQQGEAP